MAQPGLPVRQQVPPSFAGPVDREPLRTSLVAGVDARVRFRGGFVDVERDDGIASRFQTGAPVSAADLRGLRVLRVDVAPPTKGAGRWLETVAATGTVVALGAATRQSPFLDGRLTAVTQRPLPEPWDLLGWERRSVQQRRAALATRYEDRWPEVTTVLCSQRADQFAGVVAAMAGQRYPGLELVVVCHGPGFRPDVVAAACDAFPGPVEVVRVDASVSFGHALQSGFDRASGALITKVDDDDRYGPWHVLDLVLAHGYSGATLVGKFPSAVYLEGLDQTVWREDQPPERFTPALAGGTLMLRGDALRAAGGWPDLPSGVDTGLISAILAAGGSTYRTHALGYLLTRHARGHTWQVDDGAFLRTAALQWLGRHEGTLELDGT